MKAFIVNLQEKILVGRRRAINGIIKYQLRKWMFYTTGKSDLNIVKGKK